MSERLEFAYWRIIERYRVPRGAEDATLKELVGKSLKQTIRYFNGAEIPFSVVYTFALAAKLPVGWIAGDEYFIDRGMKGLRSPFIRIDNDTEEMSSGWADRLSVKATAEMSRFVSRKREIDHVVDLSGVEESKSTEAVEAVNEWLMEELAKAAITEYATHNQTLPAAKIAAESAAMYNELCSIVRDPHDKRAAGAVLPLVVENLRKRLLEAAAAPGTGKHAAS